MIDYAGYILIRFLSLVFCALPLRLGLFIGRQLGTAAWLLNRKRRAIAYVNLKAAFCREKTPSELRRLVQGVYQNLGQVLIETLRFPVINKGYIKKFITLEGFERLEEARLRNKGAIMLTAHFGNWEIGSLIVGLLNLPLSVLAREQKHTRLNELLNLYRERAGAKVIKKGLATRQLIKALKANEIIAILADQDAGKFGTFVNFFGRPASTHSGALIFAQKTQAAVLPAFITRQKGPYHTINVLGPIESGAGSDSKEAIVSGLQGFSNLLEAYVRRHPTQWLWMHKRWKSTPQRTIVILSDGKSGHLNQSLAVANIIKRFREDKGHLPERTTFKVINVRYKSRIFRLLLGACSAVSSSACQGCMRCVRLCLDEETYKAVIGCWGDIVISCGAGLAPLNIFLSRELGAKGIVIMRPGPVSLKRFNLVIAPRHDNIKAARNVLVTMGSPNNITGQAIQEEARRFASFIELKSQMRLGLILGGDSPDYQMEPSIIRAIISRIKLIAESLNLELLATTSRRTPREVEDLLQEELAHFPNCRLLVAANKKNIEGAVPAILGLSSVVLVSGESVSMVSEAASSGKAVLVFPLRKKKARMTRHERFIRELDRLSFIRLVEPDAISDAIVNAVNSSVPPKRLNDYERIYNAVGALI